jgi:hypothetical protein
MNKTYVIAALALAGVAAAGFVVAQSTDGTAPSAQTTQVQAKQGTTGSSLQPAAQGTPVAQTSPDAAHEARFVAADKDKSNALEGAELDNWRSDLAKIDSDSDGKVSKPEFVAAAKANVIK